MNCSPYCNRRPRTGPIVFGFAMPLCWRCTSAILSAFAVENLSNHIANVEFLNIGVILTILGAALGLRSYWPGVVVENTERVVGGLILGVGLSSLLLGIGDAL